MDKQLFPKATPEERVEMLRDNCDKIENQTYMRQFSQDELVKMKENLAEVSIKISDIADEKKIVLKEFSEKEKPMTTQKKGLLKNLKRKAEEVSEDCFKFIDQETQNVGYYNELGDLVYSRPIYPEERQKTIFSIHKDGTND